jgi:hypothetical protein
VVKIGVLWLAISVCVLGCSDARRQTLSPNRGTQLFVAIRRASDWRVVPITQHRDYVVQGWHPEKGTYDFIVAEITSRSSEGCKVAFTRFVMGEDYIPRTEHAEFSFPYAEQPRYHLFDTSSIVGFYRNSLEDLSPEELLGRPPPNHAIQVLNQGKSV